MAADLETRALRVTMGQAGLLQLRMSMSQPEPDEHQGMLFKRTVQVPLQGNLEMLLAKWNPGLPPDTLEDLMTSVCRWNQLKNSESVRPGQNLLIPSVFPHGKEPQKRKSPASRSVFVHARPPVSRRLSLGSQLAEQRTRQALENSAGIPRTRAGSGLSRAKAQMQLQGRVWNHGPQRLPATLRA